MKSKGENIYRRKDGRWEGRYIKERKSDGKIRYGYVYSRNFTEVKKKLFLYKMQYKENYLGEGKKPHSTMTFQVWANHWLIIQEKRVKPNTYISYESKLKNHLLPYIGQCSLNELTSADLQETVNHLRSSLSPSSLRAVFRVLRTCLNEAVKKELLTMNPLDQVNFPSEEHQKVKAFSAEEQDRIITAISNEKYLPILTAMYTGLRIGEIAGLTWEDIDWEEEVLYVRNNAQRVRMNKANSQSKLVIMSPKTALSQRVIPLNESLLKKLRQLQKVSNSRFVFSSNNAPLDPRTIRNRFKKIKKIAQVPDLPFHALRHTFATRCIENGVTITTISALLGHRSIKMTLDIYTSSFISEKREAISKIG